MQSFVLLFGPVQADKTGQKHRAFSVQAERIEGAVRQALAMETKLLGLTLRAVWWEGSQPHLSTPVEDAGTG